MQHAGFLLLKQNGVCLAPQRCSTHYMLNQKLVADISHVAQSKILHLVTAIRETCMHVQLKAVHLSGSEPSKMIALWSAGSQIKSNAMEWKNRYHKRGSTERCRGLR